MTGLRPLGRWTDSSLNSHFLLCCAGDVNLSQPWAPNTPTLYGCPDFAQPNCPCLNVLPGQSSLYSAPPNSHLLSNFPITPVFLQSKHVTCVWITKDSSYITLRLNAFHNKDLRTCFGARNFGWNERVNKWMDLFA